MFNGLPEVFPDRVQNAELYMQKRIYSELQFLSILPMEQNETGLFSNYIHGDINVGKPLYTNNGITFNEIKFGKGQTVGGQTLPNGLIAINLPYMGRQSCLPPRISENIVGNICDGKLLAVNLYRFANLGKIIGIYGRSDHRLARLKINAVLRSGDYREAVVLRERVCEGDLVVIYR